MENDLPCVEIYTDGSCDPNPGRGGWCAILSSGGNELIVTGTNPEATNNMMELFAIRGGLQSLKTECNVTIFSDSIDAIKWCTGEFKSNAPRLKPIVYEIRGMMLRHHVTFFHVKAHSGVELNERSNNLAQKAMREI